MLFSQRSGATVDRTWSMFMTRPGDSSLLRLMRETFQDCCRDTTFLGGWWVTGSMTKEKEEKPERCERGSRTEGTAIPSPPQQGLGTTWTMGVGMEEHTVTGRCVYLPHPQYTAPFSKTAPRNCCWENLNRSTCSSHCGSTLVPSFSLHLEIPQCLLPQGWAFISHSI